ncbi:MAG: hypothetical protein WCR54_00145 [Clostridia bacterium]
MIKTIIIKLRRKLTMNNVVKTGEKPGQGTYSCTNCNQKVELNGDDKMPPCPNCHNNGFTRQ